MRKRRYVTEIQEYTVRIYCPPCQIFDDEWVSEIVYFEEPYTTKERAEWLYQKAIKMHQEKLKNQNYFEDYPKKLIYWKCIKRDTTEEEIDQRCGNPHLSF